MEPEFCVAFFADAVFFSGYKVSSDRGCWMNHELRRLWKDLSLKVLQSSANYTGRFRGICLISMERYVV